MTPDYPGRTGQNGGEWRAGSRVRPGQMRARLRLELLDLVAEQRGRDRRLARLALQEGLGELLRLQPEDRVNTPVRQPLDEVFRCDPYHLCASRMLPAGPGPACAALSPSPRGG